MALQPLAEGVQERLLALVARARTDPDAILDGLRELRELDGISAFALALRSVVPVELSEVEAESVLAEILRHQAQMRRGLGRDPGLRVAALDFLTRGGSRFARHLALEVVPGEPALRDALTDLLTGSALLATLDSELRRCRRSGQPLALVLIETGSLDNGARGADVVLQRIASAIRRTIRDTDRAGVLSAERIGVLLLATELRAALGVALRIRERVQRARAETGVARGNREPSLGVCAAPADGRSAARLLERAEQALHVARESGERVFAHHSERRAALRQAVASSLRASIVRRGASADNHAARPIDLSRRGALLATGTVFAVRESVRIRLALEWEVAREMGAEIVRVVHGSGTRPFAVGVRFDAALADDAWLSHALARSSQSAGSDA